MGYNIGVGCGVVCRDAILLAYARQIRYFPLHVGYVKGSLSRSRPKK